MTDAWITWTICAFGVGLIGTIVWLAIRGWVKYPEERGKGGFPFNNQVPGLPPVIYDRTLQDLPPVPTIVIPSEKQQGLEPGDPVETG